jgi:small redox-active disulfide protein 2
MTIQILGSGCPKCRTLERNAREAAARAGLEATIEKITDTDRIADMGVMLTPAIAVDGIVLGSGRVLTADEIVDLVTER